MRVIVVIELLICLISRIFLTYTGPGGTSPGKTHSLDTTSNEDNRLSFELQSPGVTCSNSLQLYPDTGPFLPVQNYPTLEP